jgi:hypothetical protein
VLAHIRPMEFEITREFLLQLRAAVSVAGKKRTYVNPRRSHRKAVFLSWYTSGLTTGIGWSASCPGVSIDRLSQTWSRWMLVTAMRSFLLRVGENLKLHPEFGDRCT